MNTRERYDTIMFRVEKFDRNIDDKSHEEIADFYQMMFDSMQGVADELLASNIGGNSTPGPWSYENILKILSVGPDGHADHSDDKANARLIAAAPELLAALKTLANVATETTKNLVAFDGAIYLDTAIDKARAAIAAAEGGGGMKMEKELDKIAENITNLTACMINILTMDVKSDFPYKAQYVLEKVIKRLGERV